MAFTKSRKVHLRKFKLDLERGRVRYFKWGSACGTADIYTDKLDWFKECLEKYPNEVCKNCVKKYREMIKEIKTGREK